MKLYTLLLLTSFLSVSFAFSQNADSSKVVISKEGNVEIIQDRRVDSLVSIHKKLNEEKQSMEGFRVQLFFGADRKKANDIKADFLQKYPEATAHLLYQQPNYKVRVGDFRTRLEAYKFYKTMITDFPSAFIVKDEIKLPEIE